MKALAIAANGDGPAWTPPEVDDKLETRLGGSFVDEFVLGHSASDILRELVQNEFDAGGHAMAVSFGLEALTISGTGSPIAADGWKRLSVIVGTGRTVGAGADGEVIEAKVNGIGSKNFGLRSLFLYGNRIHVRSAGQVAILDLPTLGTARVPDPGRMLGRGVSLQIPYRTETFDKLAPFTLEDEGRAFDSMSGAMLATLAKLATPGEKKGLRELILRSERLGRTVSWKQSVTEVECRAPSVDALRRTGRMDVQQGGALLPRQAFDEIEFGRSVAIPPEFADIVPPGYFRRPRRRIRIGVSLPLERGRPALHAGRFFYPLQAPRGGTGSSVDVSAPFELNSDRSALHPNDWNDWLCRMAARLVVDLLTSDWYTRFGPAIYSALLAREPADPSAFRTELDRLLAAEQCWPTASPRPRERFAKAGALAIATDPLLEAHLPPRQQLDPALQADEALPRLAIAAGAKQFTLNSLVRRRCAGEDASALETELGEDEADLPFDDYETAMTSVETQASIATTLSRLRVRLSAANKRDLKESPSTLTRSLELAPAGDLVSVDPAIASCPQPDDEQLHPALFDKRAISRHCKPFDEDDWIQSVCERAGAGDVDEAQRRAVEKRVLEGDGKLGRLVLAAVKRSPVIRDHRGDWTAPADMRALKGRSNSFFLGALSAPSPTLARRAELVALLRIPDAIDGDDLVATAKWVAANPGAAEQFELELDRRLHLLTRPAVRKLSSIAFLRTAAGGLAAPSILHVANELNRLCVGPDRLVAGFRTALYDRLDISVSPDPDAIVETLARLAEKGAPPPRPEQFYTLVARVAAGDRAFRERLAELPVLWAGGDYQLPDDVLAGLGIPYLLDDAVPVVRGPFLLVSAYQSLGAASQPRGHHWQGYFEWVGETYGAEAQVPAKLHRQLLDAYQLHGSLGLPPDLDSDVPCLLDRRGKLYSLDDVRAGRLIENDFGALADAVDESNLGIGIADVNERSGAFFGALGLSRLTNVSGAGIVGFGAPVVAQRWFDAEHREGLLRRLLEPMMRDAVHKLASHLWRDGRICSADEFEARLSSIRSIEVFNRIDRDYSLGAGRVSVSVEVGLREGVLGTVRPWTRLDVHQLLAQALAELAGHADIADVRQFAAMIMPLLMCRNQREIDVYLSRQGIVDVDPGPDPLDDDDEDAEEADRHEREELVEDAFSDMLNDVMSRSNVPPPPAPPPVPAPAPAPPAPPPPPFTLPPLDHVSAEELDLMGTVIQPRTTGGYNYGYGSYGYQPRTAADVERDNKIGRRGEEVVYRLELERVRGLGHERPEDHVIWVADANPGADHDIQSIDEDGRVIWLEVKATTGSDGRFIWPRREFEKAVSAGERYEICRVYQAAGTAPQVKRFRNPVALLSTRQILLDLNDLKASVEAI
jgi:hypothetical protein